MTRLEKYNVVYDIETFPNFFSVCFYELKTKKYRDFVIYKTRNDLEELRRYWMNTNWKIGFNNVKFDDILMRFIMEGGDSVSPSSINEKCRLIISSQKNRDQLWKIPQLQNYLKPYDTSIDLMKIHALNKRGVSLKMAGVILNHPRLEDLPKDPTSDISDDEVELLLSYGRNDVEITYKLYLYSYKDIILRNSVSSLYNVNVITESRTYIAKKILDKYYQEFTGDNIATFKDLRSTYTTIDLKDIIQPFNFKTKPLQDLYNKLRNTTIDLIDPDFKFEEIVETKAMSHKLALGGLHSQNKNNMYEENDEYCLLDVDFASYYPNLMLKYELFPTHLKKEFLKVLEFLTKQRLQAKKDGDKVTADTLKISINSLYGLLGFDHYWLKDDKLMYSVTINGQLMLLAVIETLEALGDVKCIYSNTDGATFKVLREDLPETLKMVDRITDHLGIELEAEMFSKMVVKDVNNFMMTKTSGEIKVKGSFLYTQDVTKGYKYPIVKKALYNYYIHDIPVAKTIEESTDIYGFCMAQKTGKQFRTYFRTTKGLKEMQKTNRYFVTDISGSLIKIKQLEEGGESISQAVAGENVYILNDYQEHMDNYYLDHVKRGYYIKEANKIINSFISDQYVLF